MVAKTYIERSLLRIDRLYRGPCSAEAAILYSKLATLELCGWIEVSMDDVAVRLAKRLLKEPSDRTEYESEVVKKVYGFAYESDFKRLLIGVVGRQGVARMEKLVDRTLFDPMLGALRSLKPIRNSQAHTYVKGTTLVLDAPSITIAHLPVVYDGLKNVESVLRTF